MSQNQNADFRYVDSGTSLKHCWGEEDESATGTSKILKRSPNQNYNAEHGERLENKDFQTN